ncbi:MAG: hypothetical protein ACRYFU_19885 [Janthinobacterium lividum]
MEADIRASLDSDTYRRTVNPFGVTKSDDFSDEEINAYWIEPGESSAEQMLAPTRRMPMQVLGGKGSGKTHLLRRLALKSQERWKTSNSSSPLPYFAIYVRCDGLNAHRFSGRLQTEDVWNALFRYFLDLWLTHALLTQVANCGFKEAATLNARDEQLPARVWDIFTEKPVATPTSLKDLIAQLRGFLREIDVALNNLPLTMTLDLRIRVTPSRLIFEVPELLAELVPELKSAMTLYLLDEMENLTESQQTYVNTLVRHRKGSCSFRLGARLYGIRTNRTLDGEVNRSGSEFDTLQLDGLWRHKKSYQQFCEELCIRRLSAVAPGKFSAWDANRLHSAFEDPGSELFYKDFTTRLVGPKTSEERPYFKKLYEEMEQFSPQHIESIPLLYRTDFPLLEKLNIYLFYKAWSKKEDLALVAAAIQKDCSEYVEHGSPVKSRYAFAYQHFSLDLLAQLQRDAKTRVKYVGFDTFVQMSAGLPRNLLIILKNIFDWAVFNGESPFLGKPIAMDTQERGVIEAASWFFDDARPKQNSEQVQLGIERLATLFREIRYSDKPSECSICTFSAPNEGVSQASQELLHLAVDWSMLIKHERGQKDRNSSRVDEKFQLSPMLCPRWELPLARRGALALSAEELSVLFSSAQRAEWESARQTRVGRMNVPFAQAVPDDRATAPLFGVRA